MPAIKLAILCLLIVGSTAMPLGDGNDGDSGSGDADAAAAAQAQADADAAAAAAAAAAQAQAQADADAAAAAAAAAAQAQAQADADAAAAAAAAAAEEDAVFCTSKLTAKQCRKGWAKDECKWNGTACNALEHDCGDDVFQTKSECKDGWAKRNCKWKQFTSTCQSKPMEDEEDSSVKESVEDEDEEDSSVNSAKGSDEDARDCTSLTAKRCGKGWAKDECKWNGTVCAALEHDCGDDVLQTKSECKKGWAKRNCKWKKSTCQSKPMEDEEDASVKESVENKDEEDSSVNSPKGSDEDARDCTSQLTAKQCRKGWAKDECKWTRFTTTGQSCQSKKA